MTKKEFQQYWSLTDEDMALLDYYLKQGCKIIKIVDK